MLKIAILGAGGYTGIELIRILSGHKNVKISIITSEKFAGKKLHRLHGIFAHLKELEFESLNAQKVISESGFVFAALPHTVSMSVIPELLESGKKVVDLSADYRLTSSSVYSEWYNTPHSDTANLSNAVYGLPELKRDFIRKAKLVANPGCYPTSAILSLAPVITNNLIDLDTIIIDSKSGVSGAGRKADFFYNYPERAENFSAYNIVSHRHTPEIEQELTCIAGREIKVGFTPHLLPLSRGILSTIYTKLKADCSPSQLHSVYQEFFKGEKFIRICEYPSLPDIHSVRATNYCAIGFDINVRTGHLIIVSAIDNLIKGASGQAVQNMNIMNGFDEDEALSGEGFHP